ncbi:MAG: hypothetical protein R3244_09650 [Thermoanaerobaculia bacterium]|nr:hypothetical protein [Thermoanaerobaculia bacterium]
MSRWSTIASFTLAGWALAGVLRAIGLADGIAAGSTSDLGAVWLEMMIWLGPALALASILVVAVSRPGTEVDPYLVRTVRLGAMVALFALVLAWSLVLFAAYLGSLVPPPAVDGS